MILRKNDILYLLAVLITCFIFLIHTELDEFTGIILLFWCVVSTIYIVYSSRYLNSLLSPEVLAFVYLGFSLMLGHFAATMNLGQLLVDFDKQLILMSYQRFALIYIVLSLSLALLNFDGKEPFVRHTDFEVSASPQFEYIWSLSLLLALGAISFSSFSFVFPAQLALIIGLASKKTLKSAPFTLLLFVTSLSIIVAANSANKREFALALLAWLLMISANYGPSRMRIGRLITSLILLAIFVFLAILTMSVMRGYLGYPVESVFFALALLPEYLQGKNFLSNLSDNFEISHTYAALILPIDLILSKDIDLLWGSTVIKPIFIPFSRDIFLWKPESAITVFTQFIAPQKFVLGQSFPVPLPSELFMNFSFFGVFPFLVIMKFARRIFCIANSRLGTLQGQLAVLFCTLLILLQRGSGFDLFTLNLIFGSVILLLLCFGRKLILSLRK